MPEATNSPVTIDERLSVVFARHLQNFAGHLQEEHALVVSAAQKDDKLADVLMRQYQVDTEIGDRLEQVTAAAARNELFVVDEHALVHMLTGLFSQIDNMTEHSELRQAQLFLMDLKEKGVFL